MKFSLDTNDYESLHLEISAEEWKSGLGNIMQELCFALSSFYIDFASRISFESEEQCEKITQKFVELVDANIKLIMSQGIINFEDEDGNDG